ncbi:MAG TPA: PmoA family protein [Chloroflexota bacterium]|nr:PmoA family protein [Chloroflexota bacterium]
MSPETRRLRLVDDLGSQLDVRLGDTLLLCYQYGHDRQIPFIHPLHTRSGRLISLDQPYDHLWHHGLFFSWPNVNGFNFWETSKKYEGRRGRIFHERFLDQGVGSEEVSFRSANRWVTETGVHLLDDTRCFRIHGCTDQIWRLDFQIELVGNEQPLTFGCVPPYHGLSFRPQRSLDRGTLLNSDGGTAQVGTRGVAARWCVLAGQLDDPPAPVGLAMLDHPSNFRHPSSFFTMLMPDKPFSFLAVSPCFHEPYAVPAGTPLRLRYRVLIFDGPVNPASIESEWQSYAREED